MLAGDNSDTESNERMHCLKGRCTIVALGQDAVGKDGMRKHRPDGPSRSGHTFDAHVVRLIRSAYRARRST